MGRPAGSKNKPRAPTASGSAPIDHNQSKAKDEGLTDDQMQKLFQNHLRQYEKALEVKKAAAVAFLNVCKLAKSEGTKIEDIKTAILLKSEEGNAVLQARVEAELRVARWMGAPVGSQFEMFADTDRTPSDEKAEAEGKRDGLAGRDFSNAYKPGSRLYESYRSGYDEGQKVNIAGIRQKDGEEFDRTNHDQAAADEAHSLPDPTIAETIHAADPFGDGVGDLTDRDLPLDPEASANQTANSTPISNGRKRNGRGGSKDAEPVTAA